MYISKSTHPMEEACVPYICRSFRHLDGGFVMLSEALHPIPQMEPLPPNLAAERGFWGLSPDPTTGTQLTELLCEDNAIVPVGLMTDPSGGYEDRALEKLAALSTLQQNMRTVT
ncbi:hypothetical protein CHARACLAT_020565 [Characodon lateralis]|uniref:Uncharacterized protein n=1 Tax=Characodon lateralis TaxID=208331 RepID=A0ABU7DUZ7_9TELE|nr:hypothetical protein [Characodon lateralis]